MGKRRGVILLAIIALSVGLLWLLFVRAPVREGRCRLSLKKADPESQLLGLAVQFVRPLDDRPDSVRDFPADFEQPRCYEIKSGDRAVLMAADFSRKNVRLCIDTDSDGILSEERRLTAEICKETPVSGSKQQFGPISLVRGEGGGRKDDKLYVKCYREDARGLLIPYPAFFRTGKLRLAGQTYRVAVVDGDYDGLYRSVLSLPLERDWWMPACDVFAIDLDHNGEFRMSRYDRSEVMPLGRLVKVAGDYYALNIASDGASLEMSKTEPQFGTLAVESNDVTAELRLWSDAADEPLQPSQGRRLPAGKYKAIYATLTKMDSSGAAWTLSSNTSSAFTRLGSLECFTIEPGETTSIQIGPPFILKTDVQRVDSGVVSLSLILVGCGGEEYSVAVQQGRQRPSPPAFKIVDEKGTVLIASNFEYG